MGLAHKGMTEAGFMATVIEMAQMYGWMVAHFRPAQNKFGEWRTAVQADGKGFPDLFMVRAKTGHRMAAELKVGANKATPEQETWLASMQAAGIPAFLWRPTDWEAIEQDLREGLTVVDPAAERITPQQEADARTILRWMLDPTLRPFTPELEQAACRCASLIVHIANKQKGQA